MNEIDLLIELQVCFKLGGIENQYPEFIFPSLGIEGMLLVVYMFMLNVVFFSLLFYFYLFAHAPKHNLYTHYCCTLCQLRMDL